MNIIDVYKAYGIPTVLQNHMLRVAACSKLIIDNWTGCKLDKNKILRVQLLHDMGNIIKIPLNDNVIEIPDEEINNITFLYNRKKYADMFGNDDHEISIQIARELNLNEKECELMANKIFKNNENIFNSDDFELKISAYCDQRVAPDGVYPLLDRLNEAKERQKTMPGSLHNNPKTDFLIECAINIEKQIFEFCNKKPSDINNEVVEKIINDLRKFEI